jgi:ribosomal-protein-alanine N-acetyltransferase
LPYIIRRMQKADIPQATEIDREAFPTMKSPTNFERELGYGVAYYFVACRDGEQDESGGGVQEIAGYAGLWLLADEAHIVNIAVRPEYRRRGIGEMLLVALIELSLDISASIITLEVRISNRAAQGLYYKYGFTIRGVRKGYYSDNHEDAVIMTVDDIYSTAFKKGLERLKKACYERTGSSICRAKVEGR